MLDAISALRLGAQQSLRPLAHFPAWHPHPIPCESGSAAKLLGKRSRLHAAPVRGLLRGQECDIPALMQPRILVPIDFSDASLAALKWAADLQRSVGGGTVKLIHVVSIPPLIDDLRAAVMMTPSQEELDKLQESLSELAAKEAAGAETQVVTGIDIGSALMEEATQWPAELIVMGTHGRSAVGRLVFGSVATYVTRHASCPVVTVRVPEE